MAGLNNAQAGMHGGCTSSAQEAREIAMIAEFMCTDNDHVVVRRFKKLNIYNLLYLQHQLLLLDQKVSSLEAIWDGDGLAEELPRLSNVLKAYNDTLLTQARLNDVPIPPPDLVSTLRSHAIDCLKPMLHELEPQNGWLELVNPTAVRRGWIYRLVASRRPLQKLFKQNQERKDKSGLFTYSERKMEIVEQTIVNAVFSGLVLGPIWLLSSLDGRVKKLSIILVSVLATCLIASLLPGNAQRTSLGIVVGYTAILVVFLSAGGGTC